MQRYYFFIVNFYFINCFTILVLGANAFAYSGSDGDSTISSNYLYEDSLKINKLIDLSLYYRAKSKDKSLNYAYQAYDLSKIIKHQKLQIRSIKNIGGIYSDYNQYAKAKSYYLKAAEIEELSDNFIGLANTYKQLAVCCYYLADYEKSLYFSQKAIPLYFKNSHHKAIASIFNNIGVVFDVIGNKHEALKFYLNSLQIYRQIGDNEGIATSLNNAGEIYRAFQQYDSALYYYRSSYVIHHSARDTAGIIICKLNIGLTHAASKNHDSAESYLLQSLNLALLQHDALQFVEIYVALGNIYLEKKDFRAAHEYFLNAYKVANRLQLPEMLKVASLGLSKTYGYFQEYKNAFLFAEKYRNYTDSLSNPGFLQKLRQNENAMLIAKIKSDYQYRQREATLQYQSKIKEQKYLIIAALVGFVLMLIIAYEMFWNYRTKKSAHRELQLKHTEILEQKQEIASQRDNLQYLNDQLLIQKEQIIIQKNELELLNKELLEQKDLISNEKTKSDSLLKNILPKKIAEELKERGKARPHHYEVATVMFTDFVNFTRICKHLSPIELVNELDTYFAELDGIIEKHKLEKIKTIGDAYLCVGGLPEANKRNPVDIVLAAFEILSFIERINELQRSLHFPVWQLRIGIHTGELVAGVVGKKKFAYDIWGETVNIASRMQTAGLPNKINISEATFQFIEPYFNCSSRGKILTKNLGEMDMYFVDSIKPEFSSDVQGVPNSKLLDILNKLG